MRTLDGPGIDAVLTLTHAFKKLPASSVFRARKIVFCRRSEATSSYLHRLLQYIAAMVADMTHGIARALSEGPARVSRASTRQRAYCSPAELVSSPLTSRSALFRGILKQR